MKTVFSVSQTAQTLAALCGGQVFGFSTMPVTAACTDSREAGAGVLFCAFRGERVDGHVYIPAAYAAGSRCFLCERLPAEATTPGSLPNACFICVPDTAGALAQMAAGFRMAYLPDLCTVAVTGSVGKTTTKELCAGVLRATMPTFCREGNYNSVIGMPLCVLGIDPGMRAAVLEMGMSARGEISSMSRAASPNVAVITNIGSSHLEHLGTRENIARAKLEILDGMRSGGILLFDGDEPLLRAQIPDLRKDIRLCAVSLIDVTADFCASKVQMDADGTTFDLRLPDGTLWQNLRVPAIGRHVALDAAYAAGVGYLAGVSREEVTRGLLAYHPATMRQTVHHAGGVTILEDCYNAAPESVLAALEALSLLAAQAGGRCMALLGDMKELGADTVTLHRRVGEACAAKLDGLWTVGALGAEIAAGARSAGMQAIQTLSPGGEEAEADAVVSALCAGLTPGDVLLIKASRAMRLETVAGELLRRLSER